MKLAQQFSTVERLARGSRWQRFRHQPRRYAQAMWFKERVYPKTKKGKLRQAITFFGQSMQVLLPASMDIYLTGGKTHDSELRLTRWLLRNLKTGKTFVDVGAHFGYFSLLAAQLIGTSGRVTAFEAAQTTFELLQQNTADFPNIEVFNRAISDQSGTLTFYEFPTLYSEFNALDISQFEQESWFADNPPQPVQIPTIPLDDFFANNKQRPNCIKIDAEGAELQILRGATQLMQEAALVIILEYQQVSGDSIYEQCLELLNNLDYKIFIITADGGMQECVNIPLYLHQQNLQSDNIIARKL